MVMRNTIGLSPFLVLVSLLIGAAAGGIVGALFAVPITAAAVVVLERVQARRVPVAQDSTAAADADEADTEAVRQSLPDAARGSS
jgi:predicted PurR-regulated permease PerM